MKFMHLGDLHLGKYVNDFSMIEDQEYILKQILKIATERNVDAVLIAGDIYDKTVPSEKAVRLFNHFLTGLHDKEIKVFAIAGNHDSDERLDFAREILSESDVHIVGKYTGSIPNVSLKDEYGDIKVWMLPFIKMSYVRAYHPNAEIETYEDALKAALENEDVDTSVRNIIMAHQYVTAFGNAPEAAGSETIAPESIGAVEMIDYSVFDNFEYAALGHVHRAQRVGRDTVRYSGSPLKYSLNEIRYRKTVPIVTLKQKGEEPEIELVDLIPLHEMKKITGTLDELLSMCGDGQDPDYIYAVLTDHSEIKEAFARLRMYYPNAMKMEYANLAKQTFDNDFDISSVIGGTGFQGVIREFFTKITGEKMTEQEWKMLMETAKEAGVDTGETN